MAKKIPSEIVNPQSLRVLIVEDSEDDALLIIRELRKGGYDPVYERVETATALKKALKENQWDVILCDYKLPKFNAPSAIAILKETNIDIPVIIVSGTIGEDTAVECMRLGAQDYIMKGNLSRLCPAIARELIETKARNKHKQADEALRASEEKSRNILENMQEGYFELDLAGNFTFVNDAECKNLGYTREELIGMNNRQYQDETTAQQTYHLFRGLYKTGKPVKATDVEIIRKNGTTGFNEVSASLIRDAEDKPIGFRGISRDITERKRTESQREAALEALRKSEENFRRSLYDSSLGVRIVTAEGETLYANQAALDIYGYDSIEEMRETPLKNRYTPESYAAFQIRKGKRKRGEFGPSEYEISIVRKNGEIRQLHVFRKETIWNGTKQFQVIYHDITERKQAESQREAALEALRKSEEKYRSIIENMQESYFENDPTGKFTYVNDAMCRNIGYPREELVGKDNRLFTNEENTKKIYRAYNGIYRTGKPAKVFEVEYVRKNGLKGFAEFSISLISDAEGKPIGFRTVAWDVTERKQAESQREAVLEELRKSEEKYRLVVENAKEAILITRDAKIVFVNRAAIDMIGYSEEILTPKPFADFIHPDDRNMVADHYIRRMKEEEVPAVYSFRLLSQDGTVKWVELTVAVIQWKGRLATLNFLKNITERKQMEDERKQSFERMRNALKATVHSISLTVEKKDPYTSGHQQRVSDLARLIAIEMGLSTEQQDFIRTAANIHDIGKIAIPSEILSKPAKLTALEYNLIKTHAQSGYDILKDIEFPWPVADVVLQHHERLDGSGYPQGIKGTNILLEARILAIADVVEAMSSHRPYRPAKGIEAAMEEISSNKGVLYDVDAVDACLKLFQEKGYTLV
jgi:PAS domain S-box-containing protein